MIILQRKLDPCQKNWPAQPSPCPSSEAGLHATFLLVKSLSNLYLKIFSKGVTSVYTDNPSQALTILTLEKLWYFF